MSQQTTEVELFELPMATNSSKSKKYSGIEWSPMWALFTVIGIGALSIWARSGLVLIGFLGIIVLAHEGGHLLAARRSGMRPTEYFWGFGPEIVAFDFNGCRYGIKAILAGGYVKIHGMTPTSELPEGFAEADSYRAASHRGRLFTILAGPGVNLALAVVAFAVALMMEGVKPLSAIGQGFGLVWSMTVATIGGLWTFFTSLGGYVETVFGQTEVADAPVRFMSPVAQAQVSNFAVESGLGTSLRWFAILSCAIGIVNLLPLPPLDGSHAVVAFVEGVWQRLRRDPSQRLNVTRLAPLAWVTLGVLVMISLSALVIDIRELV